MSLVSCCCSFILEVTAPLSKDACNAVIPVLLRDKYFRSVLISLVFGFIFLAMLDGLHQEEMLTAESSFRFAPILGGGNPTSSIEHMQIQQHLFSLKGLAFTVSNSSGSVNSTLLRTKGEFFSGHRSGHAHRGSTDEAIAYFGNTLLSFRDIWEVRAYNNTCGLSPQKAEKDGGIPMFPFARMTKHFWTFYPSFTMERYRCDGSLVAVWAIVPRFWLSALRYWDVREPSSGRLVGTIDEKALTLRQTFEATISAGEDPVLFAHAVILAASSRAPGSSGGSSGSNNGGGGLRVAGGAGAAAR